MPVLGLILILFAPRMFHLVGGDGKIIAKSLKNRGVNVIFI